VSTIGHIVYNSQQLAALSDMESWVASHVGRGVCGKPYILQGYAGTGKTTLLRELLQRLKISLSRVALVAPTNRAAKVLQSKTGLHTQTIHKLIYMVAREELDYQRERLEMWDSAASFMDLADLIIVSNETDLPALFQEFGGGSPEDYSAFVEKHRRTVLSHEGVELPEDPQQRQEYFVTLRQERIKEHKEKIRVLLKEPLKTRAKRPEEILERWDLIIVDEASMVDQTVGGDLVSYGVPVILVGDPYQLPPVKAKPYWHGMRPDSELTKIERQKGPGAGIPLAGEQIRKGFKAEANDSLLITERGVLTNQDYLSADQIIAGTHKTRERLCRLMRKEQGHTTAWPQPGEKLVAKYNDKGTGIMNGELYVVERAEPKDGRVFVMDIRDPFGKVIKGVTAWTKGLDGRDHTDMLPDHHGKFWWGYCITCHQSQGSEWEHVIVCNDWPGDSYDRWLYTAITRASRKCELVGY
jgi:exodeoxyribonuclease-5